MSDTPATIPATSTELNITTQEQLRWTAPKLIVLGLITLGLALAAIMTAANALGN